MLSRIIDHKYFPAFLLILVLLSRLIWIKFNFTAQITGDAISYHGFAIAILNKVNWLSDPNFTGNARPPVYPLFVSLVYYIFGIKNILALIIAQAVISAFTSLYIYKLALKLFNKPTAIISLFWSIFYIFYLKYTVQFNREILVFFLITIFFYYFYEYILTRKKLWLSLILLFLLIHTDTRYLILAPFCCLIILIYHGGIQGFKNALKYGVITILLLLPWTYRNYIAYDGLVVVCTKDLDFRQHKDVSAFMYTSASSQNVNFNVHSENVSEDERLLIKSGENPNKRSKQEIALIKKDVYPASSFWERRLFMFKQFWRVTNFKGLYFPNPSGKFSKWSMAHNLTNILCYGILLPFFIFAMGLMLKRKHKAFLFIFLPILLLNLFHTFMWSRERYRNPIDFLIIIVAFYGIITIGQWMKTKINKA